MIKKLISHVIYNCNNNSSKKLFALCYASNEKSQDHWGDCRDGHLYLVVRFLPLAYILEKGQKEWRKL